MLLRSKRFLLRDCLCLAEYICKKQFLMSTDNSCQDELLEVPDIIYTKSSILFYLLFRKLNLEYLDIQCRQRGSMILTYATENRFEFRISLQQRESPVSENPNHQNLSNIAFLGVVVPHFTISNTGRMFQ